MMTKQKEKEKSGNEQLDGVITDKRFVHLHSDPRFMRLPRNKLKVSIDSRFQRMFSDKNFSESLAIDKRGRPKKKKYKGKLLENYYHLGQEEENEENANKQAEETEEDKAVTDTTDERGSLPGANSAEKTQKKKKKKHEDKHDKSHSVTGDGIGTLDNANSQKKKKEKKKGTPSNDKPGDLNETLYTEGGLEDNQGIQLEKMKKKKNRMNDTLGENLDGKEGGNDDDVAGSMKMKNKKQKNKVSIGLDEDILIEEAEENQTMQEKKKKKKKTKINNNIGDSEEKLYTKNEGASMASGGCKTDSVSKSKKMKGGNSKEHPNATVDLNVAKGSQTDTESGDEENQETKKYSIFSPGKKGSTDDDQDSSESEYSLDEHVDLSESEESESSSSSDDDEDEDDYQIELESPKEEVPTVDCETRRLAVVNMDWNHIKAVDLLLLMNSLLPKGGCILSVSVYPSEFGLKQMAEEAVRGPALFGSDDESSEDDENELDNEKLRQYEKARLRYYYAVIECDSCATADYLYKACDGVEFERTSNVLDLRFIPDDMAFDHTPRDVATEVPIGYEAPDFHTRALQHSRVNISWDDDEPLRVKTLHRKYDPEKLNEMDFKDYLASDDDVSDSDDDNEEEDVVEDEPKRKKGLREKYQSLLLESGYPSQDGEDKDDKDMEITFNTGLEELSKRILEKNKKNNSEETVWEAYLRKRSEKRKARKNMAKRSSEDESGSFEGEDAENEHQDNESDDFFLEDSLDEGEEVVSITGSKVEKTGKKQSKSKVLSRETKLEDASKAELELLLADDHGLENGVRGYNLKPKKSKGRKQKEFPSEDKLPTVDYDDQRFSALFTSHHFAIDPTDPQFKRSATYSRSIVQKQQKKFVVKAVDDLKQVQKESKIDAAKVDDSSTKKRKTELSSLIKSVKRKVGTLQS